MAIAYALNVADKLEEGADRAHFLIEKVIGQAREAGVDIPYSANTEYINTIPADQQPKYPGNPDMEIKIHSYIRWNAMAMVVRANKDTNVGGHIASFASAAALYDVGFRISGARIPMTHPAAT
jgi:pyruvate dehydrogenase E1 component